MWAETSSGSKELYTIRPVPARAIASACLPLLLAGFALGSERAPAADLPKYVSRVWRTQDGLPESRIRAIAQTPDGYLWIGTPGGLARFDGVRFVVYSRFNTPSMNDENIRSLAVARDGSLWIATDGGGLLHYQNGIFRSFGPKDGLANEFVGGVLEDRTGDIWAATNRGLYRRHALQFERVDAGLHLSNIAFFGLCEPRDGSILTGGPAGLFRVAGGAMSRYGPIRDGEEQVYSITETSRGSLWLSTNHGLRIIDGRQRELRRPSPKGIVGAIAEDHRGNMWVGTVGDGLFLVGPGGETSFQAPGALPNNSVTALLEDREQNLWVGTSDGLVRMSAPVVSSLNSRNGLADDNISTIYNDRHGALWLTTITGKIVRYVDGHAVEVHLPAPAAELRFRGTYEDYAGAFWFGTDNQGVVRVTNGKATRFTITEGLRNNGFQAFYEDRDRGLWIGTTSGLSRWDGAHFKNYYLEDGLSYGWVRAIVEDRNGEMLVGTDRGITRFRSGRFVQDGAFAELAHDRIWSIYSDAAGALWIGTRGSGLARVWQGKVSRLTTEEGLISNSIFHLVGDAAGKLWMSGPTGISSAAIADLNAVADGKLPSLAVLSYGTGDGLESAQINGGVQPAGSVASDGQLWFPSVRGAIHFRPDDPTIEYHAPVRVESVLIDNQRVAPSGELVIKPGQQHVEIEFTACTLRAPERVAFRYKMDGVDERWMAVTGRRTANYYNLPPGRHRFQVIARDGSLDGGASEAGLSIVVLPHFYQTAWFYVLAFGIAAACVFGALHFQERQARDRYNLRLAERTRIAREMHDTVVQGCVGVSTLIEAAVSSARSDQDLMLECLDNARIHLRLTLDEARQALSDLRHDSFERGLSGALSELARSTTGERGARVTLEVAGEIPELPDATNRALLLVGREAIRNAQAHAAGTEVSVRLSFGAARLRLEIADNGRGFEPATGRLAAAGHFGILGMRERMEQIGGGLEISSQPDGGTVVAAVLFLKSATVSS
jgi:ligand-binding sensor domain-containing protein/signal transduction histidine kinase